jgi:hypothetical protein
VYEHFHQYRQEIDEIEGRDERRDELNDEIERRGFRPIEEIKRKWRRQDGD